jgi:hypothetical protein
MTDTLNHMVKRLKWTELDVQREAIVVKDNRLLEELFSYNLDYHLNQAMHGRTVDDREAHRAAWRALRIMQDELNSLGDNSHG